MSPKKKGFARTKFGTNDSKKKSTKKPKKPKTLLPMPPKSVLDSLKLTPKQRLFVQEYLIDLNATQAAIRAGYSVKNAEFQAHCLLKNPKVKQAIKLAMYEREQRTKVTQDRVIQELAKIAFLNPTDVINEYDASLHNGAAREDTAAISSIRVKRLPTKGGFGVEREIKLHDKIRALELLGKHLRLFNDKLNITADAVVRIVDDLSDSKDDATVTNGEIEE